MITDIDRFLQALERQLMVTAENKSKAEEAEEYRKSLFSELVNQSNQDSVAKAEHWARGHDTYKAATQKMIAAKTAFNVANAKSEAMRIQWETYRTERSFEKAQMSMV